MDLAAADAYIYGMVEFTLFQTAIGACGIAWGKVGVRTVLLPEGTEARTRKRLWQRFSDARAAAASKPIQHIIDDIVALLHGEPRDLRLAKLDLQGVPEFARRVYAVTRTIDPGCTLSYGELAARCGDRNDARAVGQALGSNPFPIIVPCHRVLAAGGRSGGFSAPGGLTTKLRLLQLEGWPHRGGAARDSAGSTLALPF